MILNDHLKLITSGELSNRVIASMVAKFELESRPSKGLAKDLMAHANPKQRLLSNQLPCILHSIRCCRRVTLINLRRTRIKVFDFTGPLLKKIPSGFNLRTFSAE